LTDQPAIDQLQGAAHPMSCDKVIGHETAEEEFLGSYNGGRFHHAWLITGAKGIGKATFAYRAAKFLLTQEDGGALFGPPDTLNSDPAHPAISLMNAGAHPGLMVLKRKYDSKNKKFFSAIRVDDVRGLSKFFGLKSSDGGWRVVIIDCMDDMNINSANAVLKILEEPPHKTIFFLVSHTPASLLPTIRSRCRRLQLEILADDQVKQVVQPYMGNMSTDQLNTLAALAEGSPGRAVALLQDGGLDAFQMIMEIFADYPGFDGAKLHGLADTCGKKDGEPLYRMFTELFPWWLSRLVRVAAIGRDAFPLVTGELEVMNKLNQAKAAPFWIRAWEHANQMIRRGDAVNLDRKQVVLDLFLNTTLNK
jgi:DNA polymerase III subunit delta'